MPTPQDGGGRWYWPRLHWDCHATSRRPTAPATLKRLTGLVPMASFLLGTREGSVGSHADEAVVEAGAVRVYTHDFAFRVDPEDLGQSRAGYVNLREDALLAQQEAVGRAVGIHEESYELARVADCFRRGEYGAGDVDGRVDAVAQQEPMTVVVGVEVAPGDLSTFVETHFNGLASQGRRG